MGTNRRRYAWNRVEHLLGYTRQIVLGMSAQRFKQEMRSRLIPVSPASPENAINVCLFNCLVLSSEALRMVAPLIAALEVAMRVKSLPVMPSRTSLKRGKSVSTA